MAAPNQPPVSSPNARLSALHALAHTLDKGRPLDTAWAADRHFASLSPSDRAFAQMLAKTVLRRLGQIDNILKVFLERPLEARASRIMHALRLGTAQLIWLKTPPHAAVHATVELAKQLKMEKMSGLVNAVLKKVAHEGEAIAAAQDAAKINTPGWLWESWEMAYGADITRRIAEIHLTEPPVDISVKSDPEYWAGKLGGVVLPVKTDFGGSVRLRDTRAITQLSGFSEGKWWVQDLAAAIPAKLLGDVHDKRVIDLCAAPGGKTAQLAVSGAKVSAVDRSKDRIAMLKTNVHRLQLQAEYVTTDASKWLPAFAPDAILLDAPCSATGTLRRHPDVAWHRKPEDIARLMETQKKLLMHALGILAPGGTLVYAVCSLQPEEGERQIRQLLEEHKDVTLMPIKAAGLGVPEECVTSKGEIRTLPCHLSELGGMDGFYAAVLRKKG
ncbi:MAG: 16S rRNA (cytosine(967)-C(5))-methyltransferase RsmB [Pseudomonadota bacterium]|nr:16S rRNA (cytosine(967)-C(5))-methyltransferase RsmB [Pseudomonadota bacterium]